MNIPATLFCLFMLLQGASEWSVKKTENFRVYYKPGSEKLLKNILPHLESELQSISGRLDSTPSRPIKLFLAPDPRSFMEMQGGNISPYVSGMAYPSRYTIIVRPLRGREIRHSSTNGVISHEIAHIVLHHKLGDISPPKWVDEGVAVFMGSESFWSRSERLMPIALTGKHIPFKSLENGFPRSVDGAATAYAQSGSFVGFLHKEYGEGAFLAFLDRLVKGEEMENALEVSFGLPLAELEKKWLHEIKKSYWIIAVFSGGGLLWFLISLLFIFAYIKKKKQNRERRRLLGTEDAGHVYISDDEIPPDDEEFYYH